MAIRSFQQIMDAHEAAQEMLRSLEVDVRDTLADAKAELERFHLSRPVPVGDWVLGSTFLALRDDVDVTQGEVYTLVANPRDNRGEFPFAFYDNVGSNRVFYSFWLRGIKRLT